MRARLPLILTCCLLLAGSNVMAAARPHDVAGLERLQNSTAGRTEISLDKATGTVRFLRFEPGSIPARAVTQATRRFATDSFLDEHASVFGLRDPASELELVRELSDGFGYSHVFYRQVYQGVQVYGSDFRTHFNRDGALTAISAVTLPIFKLNVVPSIRSGAAADIAISKVGGVTKRPSRGTGLTTGTPELLVFRTGLLRGIEGSNHLAYRVEVTNAAGTVREFVFVDAHTGKVLEQITGIHDAIDRQVYDGGFAPQFLRWSEGDSQPFVGGNATGINDLIDFAEDTYNLFMTLSNGTYPSYDGADALMNSILNEPNLSCPNARWTGSTTQYCNGVTGDDTVAHEWGHAYTEFTHGLIYQWQSGALNESYSDIFGEIVDLLNGAGTDAPITPRTADGSACSVFGFGSPSTDNSYLWLSGEDDPAFNAGRGIRDMWRPECYGDPGRVTSASYFCSTTDSGGVHSNSGVPNHGFALMVDGGTYNGQTITGLGLTKATQIYWRAMTVYQGPASNFSDHANAISQSCTDLLGSNLPVLSTDTASPSLSGIMIDAADCTEVDKVISAVEFHADPVQCGFQTLLENNPPVRCDGLGDLQSIFSTDWESGLAGWTANTHDVVNEATFDTPDWSLVGGLPESRPGMAAFVPDLIIGNCVDDDETGALNLDSPLIMLPSGPEVPRISVDHYLATEAGWDGGNFKISVNGGPFNLIPAAAIEVSPYNDTLNNAGAGNTNPLQGEGAFTGTDGGRITGSWGQSHINLIGIVDPGDTIQLRFDFGIDGCNGVIGWYVDEVEFYSCSEELLPSDCGNSVLDGIEQCDDGNRSNDDGCSNQCKIEKGWRCTDPISPAIVPDHSFELGRDGGIWAESSTNFDTPLCSEALCGLGTGTGPSDGVFWAWFGGFGGYEESIVSQTLAIPASATALEFDFELPACDSAQDYLELRIDGHVEYSVQGDDPACGSLGYTVKSVDITSYADGNDHSIEFYSEIFATNGNGTNFFVDRLAMPGSPSVCTALEQPSFVDGFEDGIPDPN